MENIMKRSLVLMVGFLSFIVTAHAELITINCDNSSSLSEKVVESKAGDLIHVAADTCFSCGYEWTSPDMKAISDDDFDRLSGATPVDKEEEENFDYEGPYFPQGPSYTHFVIKADSESNGKVFTFNYSRDENPEFVCKVKVIVK
jgi:hypothetical protein